MKKIVLASPRGFCAGVDRALHIVEKALEKFGSPIYVRHEIVHNQFVVKRFREAGAICVENLSEVPENSTVIFSAHGVPDCGYKEAQKRNLRILDATCPLVQRVHMSAKRHHEAGRHVILIGHAGHTEVEGHLGQLPEGSMTLIRNVEDVAKLSFPENVKLAYITQTTLSVAESQGIVDALRQKFPEIVGPAHGDICYATGNRQGAVRSLCNQVQMLLVVGSKNSSNANRLAELGTEHGIPSRLIDCVDNIDAKWFQGIDVVGLASGASTPEDLVQEVVHWVSSQWPEIQVENLVTMQEKLKFPLPAELAS